MEKKCPFSDFCAAAGEACTLKDLKEFCRPIFKPRLKSEEDFIKSRILQQSFSPQEAVEIEEALQGRPDFFSNPAIA